MGRNDRRWLNCSTFDSDACDAKRARDFTIKKEIIFYLLSQVVVHQLQVQSDEDEGYLYVMCDVDQVPLK